MEKLTLAGVSCVAEKVETIDVAQLLSAIIKTYNGLDVEPEALLRTPHYLFSHTGQIIAGVGLGRSNFYSTELHHLFVTEPFRRRGVGADIVNWCTDKAKAKNKHVICCTVRSDNTASRNLFSKLDFMNTRIFKVDGANYKIHVFEKVTGYGGSEYDIKG
jgi:RimJ/RimL family protein N-acetyltransferase